VRHIDSHLTLGGDPTQVDAPPKLEAAFRVTQQMVKDGKLLAGHDRSDGGLVTTLLEMAFAGNCGIAVDVPVAAKAAAGVPTDIATLFAEELGLVLQVSSADAAAVQQAYTDAGVLCSSIGQSTSAIGVDAHVTVAVGGVAVIDNESMPTLRDLWEATSGKLEMLQATTTCVADEATSLSARGIPPFHAPAEMCPDLSPHLGDVTA
jgi:phosphoribosylformylglycinamidine synthase